jgi:hypothetical protein
MKNIIDVAKARSRQRSLILFSLGLHTHMCTLVILYSSRMPLLLATDRLQQHAGDGARPWLPAHSCFSRPAISHTVDWADGFVPDSNLIRWVGAPAEITR